MGISDKLNKDSVIKDDLNERSFLTEVAKEWDRNVIARSGELESKTDKTYFELIIPFYKKYLTQLDKKVHIIDVGCGLGYLTNEIFTEGFYIQGVDVSKKSIKYASKKFPKIDFSNFSIIQYSQFAPEKFDVCLANYVLHNTDSLEDNLVAINRLLRIGGKLLITMPHPCFWFITRPYSYRHEFFYSEDEKYFKVPFRINGGKQHPSHITYIHRTLERYFYLLMNTGFNVSNLRELTNNELHNPPDILFLSCEKQY